ncbi:response regulator [Candidatus Curtissbacteria bacterium]|nr:response regulator [Candidatus Curtissbacteria bacterium]
MDKKRVLVVEDDQFLRDLYVELLTAEGLSVESAQDGEEALLKLEEGGYDLVLLDIMLPKKDGVAILSQLKSKPPKMANRKIIFLTNMAQESVLKRGQELGVEGYLVKSSLTPEQFINAVKKYLGL